ncbi:MAG: glycine cleavage system aminomethyltransferase GcvT [bacterium]
MDFKNTVLYDEHIKLKALMAPFAGWNMPIHYGSIIEETKHTRISVSAFDICHMGEFIVTEDPSKSSLDKIITNPVVKMKALTCRYGFLLNANGTPVDDLIVYRLQTDKWMIVVNASNIENDAQKIKENLSKEAKFEDISQATVKIDLQGPKAMEVMKKLVGDSIKKLKYFQFDTFDLLGGKYLISRTGYTGELGYELYISADKGVELWNKLLADPLVKPAGLGARDILRLEAGLPLYGDELTEDVTPLEAGMEKFLDFEKDFIGKDALLKQKNTGVEKKLTGVIIEGRRTPRHTNRVHIDNTDCGFVTSGVFSPYVNKGIGFMYINADKVVEGNEVLIKLDKGEVKGIITTPPFIKNTSIKYQEA